MPRNRNLGGRNRNVQQRGLPLCQKEEVQCHRGGARANGKAFIVSVFLFRHQKHKRTIRDQQERDRIIFILHTFSNCELLPRKFLLCT